MWILSRDVRKRTVLHEPRRTKTQIILRLTETQISLRIRAVWAEPSLAAWRNFESLAIQKSPREDSDQTARMRRLIWIFAGRTCSQVRFLASWLICDPKIIKSICWRFVFHCFCVFMPRMWYSCKKICEAKCVREKENAAQQIVYRYTPNKPI